MADTPALAPEMAAALRRYDELGAALPAPAKPDLAALRRRTAEQRRWFNEDPPPMASVQDAAAPGPFRPVPTRTFVPVGATAAPPIVYFHGGGWFSCSIDTHERAMRVLAIAARRRLVAVDYCLAPERRWPAPVQEGRAVLDALGPAVLAGCSAGAHIALSLALERRSPVTACLLFYGVYDLAMTGPSQAAFGDGRFGLSRAEMEFCWSMYLGRERRPEHAAANLVAADLRGLPPAFLAAAECDPLVDDTRLLAARMAEAGVAHDLRVYPGMAHSFLGFTRILPMANQALQQAADWLQAR